MEKGKQNHPISDGSEISIGEILDAVKAEFEAVMGSPKRVYSVLNRFREVTGKNPTGPDLDKLLGLLPLLAERIGPIVVPLFELFDELCLLSARPWPILKGMLSARDENLAILALKRASKLADSGVLSVDLDVAKFFAGRMEGVPFNRPECLSILSDIIGHMSTPEFTGKDGPEVALYLHQKDYNLRCFAARVLDIKSGPVSHDLAEKILGHKDYEFLADYLDYTRATHFDLLSLVNEPGGQMPCISSLEKAEALCGKRLLQEVIAGIGWPHVNLGLEVHSTVGVTIGRSFPLMMSSLEASLFKTVKDAQVSGESFIFVAHGGAHRQGLNSESAKDRVSRFRSFNLAHASVLADIISLSPLSREQVWRIVDLMDKIVFDFTALFSSHAEECPILTDVYQDLRGRIVSELEKTGLRPDLSTDLIRLVQSFEDPKSLGEVRTLHGLKRYLHQRGLKLGFHLVDAAGATDRAVTIVIASSKRVIQVSRCIEYVDFDQQMDETKVPYPVRIIIDGYTRQLVCGQEYLPGTRVFLYGNEVHYYLSYKNHPVFLRIDFSPPLQGGMIDLQYYGVSKYEIASHPDISLNAIREFFRRLEYDIVVKDTHIHARYDKERTVSLGVMCEKAETLFCLIPYLMEIDWVIGSLNLPVAARQEVTRAWTEFFALWGVLPINRMLTGNRQGILMAIKRGPTGDQELAWEGDGAYRDRFSEGLPPDLLESVRSSLAQMEIDANILSGYGKSDGLGQVKIERLLLTPLREAMSLGEITATPIGFNRTDQELFKKQHEAERFAEMLASDENAVAESAVMAQLVIPLEQTLGFKTTGSLNGHDVQCALIPLCGAAINLFVLRDPSGIIKLGLFTLDAPLYLWRADKSLIFQSNGMVDGNEFTMLLRQNNYPAPDLASVTKMESKGVKTIRDLFSRENPLPRPKHFAGEKVVEGQKTSPGRAVGQAIFNTEAITPEDFEGKILVAPSIRPEDYPFLMSSSGMVSTGGGILSHAGLTAMQLRKPALIIQAQWIRSQEAGQCLLCTSIEYREEKKDISGYRVIIRRDMRRHSMVLREKDLVILDSEEGALRILGQDIQCLGFHEEFRHLCEAGRRLSAAEDEKKILVLRGRRLRSLHQIERLLDRLTDPMLGRHAVHEILMTQFLSSSNGGQGEKARLLSGILNNKAVGETSLEYLRDLFNNLMIRHNRLEDEGFHIIQSSNDLYEILALRLEILRLRQTIEKVSACTDICGQDLISPASHLKADIDRMVRKRLKSLREGLSQKLYSTSALGKTNIGLHHLVRQIERLDLVLETPPELRSTIGLINSSIILKDKTARENIRERLILQPGDGGIELFPLVGWKAANLAETDRLLDKDMVPQWFAVTNRAFEEVMDQAIKRPDQFDETGKSLSLRSTISSILSRDGLSDRQKSQEIFKLWEDITLPQGLSSQVADAYLRVSKDIKDGEGEAQGLFESFVAVRSSALEEDTEFAARAGEFDTFLFIRGETALLDHLKKAFGSLWTERAIHNRRVLGVEKEEPGGGVIIQRMVHSRVSGVLQTVNIAEGNFREMVINAGWGLGQGIVSGIVSADLVLVTKEGIEEGLPLRFRYITADKEDQVVYDTDSGMGTARAKTLYYQRLRPALEYSELNDLVRTAKMLETAYGYPLDIEYCFEGQKLRILQVRPIATSMAILNETIRHYPLT